MNKLKYNISAFSAVMRI